MIPISRSARFELHDGMEADDEGINAYVVWSEGSPRWEWVLATITVVSFVALIATFPKGNFWPAAIFLVGGVVFCLWPGIWVQRMIRFYESGSVTVPWGLTVYGERTKRMRYKVSDIANIELVKDGPRSSDRYPYGVDLIMRRRESVHLATSLSKTFAVMLVVRLTQALDSVKYEPTSSQPRAVEMVIG